MRVRVRLEAQELRGDSAAGTATPQAADGTVDEVADRQSSARRVARLAASISGLIALPYIGAATSASAAAGVTNCA